MMRTQFDFLNNDLWNEYNQQVFAPACDLSETETHFELTLDIPGVSREDIKVELIGEKLTVSAERKEPEQSNESRSIVMAERAKGRFYRSFTLGRGVDGGRIEAAYKDGVLTLSIPKAESAKPKLISVN